MSDDASLAAHDRYAERVLFALHARHWARLALAAKTDWIAIDRAFSHRINSAREELHIALEAAADAEERATTDRPKFGLGALVVLIRPACAEIPGGPVYRVEGRSKSHVRLRGCDYWWPEEIFRLAPTANAKPEREA
jgi:hypothetical protein